MPPPPGVRAGRRPDASLTPAPRAGTGEAANFITNVGEAVDTDATGATDDAHATIFKTCDTVFTAVSAAPARAAEQLERRSRGHNRPDDKLTA